MEIEDCPISFNLFMVSLLKPLVGYPPLFIRCPHYNHLSVTFFRPFSENFSFRNLEISRQCRNFLFCFLLFWYLFTPTLRLSWSRWSVGWSFSYHHLQQSLIFIKLMVHLHLSLFKKIHNLWEIIYQNFYFIFVIFYLLLKFFICFLNSLILLFFIFSVKNFSNFSVKKFIAEWVGILSRKSCF